jgi:hypothetical protein
MWGWGYASVHSFWSTIFELLLFELLLFELLLFELPLVALQGRGSSEVDAELQHSISI